MPSEKDRSKSALLRKSSVWPWLPPIKKENSLSPSRHLDLMRSARPSLDNCLPRISVAMTKPLALDSNCSLSILRCSSGDLDGGASGSSIIFTSAKREQRLTYSLMASEKYFSLICRWRLYLSSSRHTPYKTKQRRNNADRHREYKRDIFMNGCYIIVG